MINYMHLQNTKENCNRTEIVTIYQYLFVDAENCSDGYQAINIGRPIKRIKRHNVFTLKNKKDF